MIREDGHIARITRFNFYLPTGLQKFFGIYGKMKAKLPYLVYGEVCIVLRPNCNLEEAIRNLGILADIIRLRMKEVNP